MVLDFQIYFETMAGTHLRDAVGALRDAGSSDALYERELRVKDPSEVDEVDFSLARDEAEGGRVLYSRRSLLFAAFAAEAYANDFLYERREGGDREALQRLPTVDKYVLLPQLVGRPDVLTRDKEPIQRIKWLFQRRDELVHAAPKDKDLTYDPENHNPLLAAKCIVAVADAASTLFGSAEAGSVLSRALVERERLLEYGACASRALPDSHATPSDQDLLRPVKQRSEG
jgi:hypothetical protein